MTHTDRRSAAPLPLRSAFSSAEARRDATAQLLWVVCDPWVDPARVAALIESADPELLVDRAIVHRLGPLLWTALGRAEARHVLSSASKAALRADAARWRARAHYLAVALERAVDPLAAAGLEPVVLKGAALAWRYPDVALRPMLDVDLLLPRELHSLALARLKREGWHRLPVPGRVHYETVLVHPDVPAHAIEVHSALDTWQERATTLRADELWERRRTVVVAGRRLTVLDPNDEALVLAVHAAKPFHCFDRLVWVADLVVVARDRAIDWAAVQATADRWRCRTILAVAAWMARQAGAALPAELVTLPGSGWRRRALAPVVHPHWPLEDVDSVVRRRLRYAFPDSGWHRLLLLLGEGKDDPVWRQCLRLPPRLARAGAAWVRWHQPSLAFQDRG